MEYEDFVIQLGLHQAGGYDVRVVESPAGRARHHAKERLEIGGLQTPSGSTRYLSLHGLNGGVEIRPLTAETIGAQLFRTLFAGEVKETLVKSLEAVEEHGRVLRVQLRINFPELARLHDLPWELLYDPEREDFLSLNRQTLFVRALQVPGPERPTELPNPLRILAVAADLEGSEHEPLDLARELANLEQATRQAGMQLEVLKDARREPLAAALERGRHHILHFLGHGWFDAESGRGGLCFEGSGGEVERVDGGDLATELKGLRDLQLVFLNACSTGRTASSSQLSPFAGAATALILGGFPAVIAMREPISDPAAIAFSLTFYQKLLAGCSIEEAVRQGRLTLHRAPQPTHGEWSVPVLFVQGRSVAIGQSLKPEAPVTATLFRRLLDHTVPRLHRALTRHGLLQAPQPDVRRYLTKLRAEIEEKFQKQPYLSMQARTVPSGRPGGDQVAVDPFSFKIHATIRQMMAPDVGGDAFDSDSGPTKGRRVRNLAQALLRSREPLVLLGDPGSGKTMALQEAIRTLIRSESERQFPSVPLYIRLGEFHVEGRVTASSVRDLVRASAPPLLRPFLDDLERDGRLILFFDGMDEMSRNRYEEHIQALSRFAEEGRERLRILFTCRINDFSATFNHRRLVLLPFGRAQVGQYLRRALPGPFIEIDGQTWTVPELTRFLTTNDIAVDTTNAFVLSLLCEHLYFQKTWPSSRVDLIASFQARNYDRKSLEAQQEWHDLPPAPDAFRAWSHLAYLISERNRGAAIPVKALSAEDPNETRDTISAGVWCGVLTNSRTGEHEQVRFEHHRYQEYFTALWVREAAPAIAWLDKLDSPRWQETMLNLALMGGAEDGVRSLAGVIDAETRRLEAAVDEKAESSSAAQASDHETRATAPPLLSFAEAEIPYASEASLADRVELGTRLISSAPKSPAVHEVLRPALASGLSLLVDRGRPVSQVKMMRGCRQLGDFELGRSLDKLVGSRVRWVSDQALVLVTAAQSGKGVGESDISTSIAIHLAASQILTRWPVFLRAVQAARTRRSRIGFLWATAFAVADLGLLLLAAWGLFHAGVAILLAIDRTAVAPSALLGLRYPLGLEIFQGLVTCAATLIGLRRSPASAWIFVFCSVPIGVVSFLIGIAMLHGVWEAFYLILALSPLYLVAPLFAALAAPIHLLVVFLYSRMPQRLCPFRCKRSTLLRIASRDFREAFVAFKDTCRLAGRMAPVLFPQLLLIAAAGLFALCSKGFSGWLGIRYRLGWSEMGFAVSFFIAVTLILRAFGKRSVSTLVKKGLGLILRFILAAAASIAIYKIVANFTRIVAGTLIVAGSLLFLFLLVRWVMRYTASRRQLPPLSHSPDEWVSTFREVGPEEQTRLLVSTSPRSLGLQLDRFQQFLVDLEPLVAEDPAQSAYWNRRDQVEQALRQERMG